MLILTPSDFSSAPAAGPTALLDWTSSTNGQLVVDHGQCAASLLPRDDDVVLVLPPRMVSWHRVTLPKVASARLRAVLDGLLEDRLLSDPADLHFALQPGGRSGQTVWVAACQKSWLRGWLQALDAAGRPVSRIAPALWPLPPVDAPAGDANDPHPPPTLHWAHDEDGQVWLATANPLGVRCTPLQDRNNSTFGDSAFGSLTSSTASSSADLFHFDPATTRLLADPSASALAERLFNQRFELISREDWLLQCAQSDWNLAQFDLSLSSSARRGQRLRQTLRRWRSTPAWRPARWGLAALLLVQLVGLNLAAWSERSSLKSKQLAVQQTLQQSFPQVTLVLDAPVQMQREVTKLQQGSGMLADGDLENMLGTMAGHAPGGAIASPSTIAFSPGDGRFSGWQTDEQGLRAMQQALQLQGWRTQFDGNELRLQPAQQ